MHHVKNNEKCRTTSRQKWRRLFNELNVDDHNNNSDDGEEEPNSDLRKDANETPLQSTEYEIPPLASPGHSSDEETEGNEEINPQLNSFQNILKEVTNLTHRITKCQRNMTIMKNSMVTKETLNESINNALSRNSAVSKENQPSFEDPDFDIDGKVTILEDYKMGFNDFNEALNATSNCRRAKKIMRTMWTTEQKKNMGVKFDRKKPDTTIVEERAYIKILRIMTELQKYKVIPVYTDNDRASVNIKMWVSDWLKQTSK
ncbi:uncharacterized protein LOC141529412 [Cotesia typhae]|uniref:uncharacterized protein LOC141529412 n=1 Tax=Cotesia typhae TaxID=2053667 RepID=UPI003D69F0DB